MKPLDINYFPLTGTVCIEASAGTGKTHTIGLIALRLVLEKKDFDIATLGVMTFSKAASAELRSRIAEFLGMARNYAAVGEQCEYEDIHTLVNRAAEAMAKTEESDCQIDEVDEDLDAAARKRKAVLPRLDNALLNLDLARISTIHGFCSSLLNEFAFETGSSFGMELLSNTDDVAMEILSDFWRRKIVSLEPKLFSFLKNLTPQKMWEEFKSLMAFPGIEVDGPSVGVEEMKKCLAAFECLRPLWEPSREEILAMLAVPGRFNGRVYGMTPENISERTLALDACFRDSNIDIKALTGISYANLVKNTNDNKKKLRYQVPEIQLLKKVQEFIETYGLHPKSFSASVKKEAFTFLRTEMKKRLAALRVRSFNTMISDLADSLDAGGRESDMDYPASVIRKRFTAVLVDEFQDTDPLQYKIFEALFAGRDDIFFAIIGDPKQAIYKFRGGDIKTYVSARKTVPEHHHYTLSDNHRSEARIIRAINGIYAIDHPLFEGNGPFFMDDIRYVDVVAKKDFPRPIQDGKVHPPLTLWEFPDAVKPDLRSIGYKIAKTIADLMDPDKTLEFGSGGDKLLLKNIAVLVKSNKTAGIMKKILAKCGIRSVTGKSGSIFRSTEADEIFLILEAILSPSNEEIVRALLVSGIYAYDTEKLIVWERSAEERLQILDSLNEAKRHWVKEGIASAINYILEDAEVFTLTLDPDRELEQERRITNFRHLIEILHIEELQIGRMPERLLAALYRMKKEADEESAAEEMEQRLESDYDAVQIFTMHKSKGLEWPVVFAPELWKEPSASKKFVPAHYEGDTRKVDLHPEMVEKIKKDQKLENQQEAMRVAYVTMTRAKYLLFAATGNMTRPYAPPKKGLILDMSPAALLLRSPKLDEIVGGDGSRLIAREEIANFTWNGRLKTRQAGSEDKCVKKWANGPILMPWTVGSYSGLTRGLSQERRSKDETLPAPEGIFAFPGGAYAGTALHTVFERIDFKDAKNLDEAFIDMPFGSEEGSETASKARGMREMIEGILTDSGIAVKRDPLNVSRVMHLVKVVMRSTIPQVENGFTLGDLNREQRLTEMEFYLSAGYPGKKAPVTADSLRKIVGDDASRISEGKSLRGYMNGKIDLVFQHKKKWYILDWKSNHLGNSAARYGSTELKKEMETHNYHLQYLFYTLALTRYLKKSCAGNFDYKKDFGGVIYLFLRGFDGTGNGVFFTRPDEKVINQLEELL